MAIYSARGKGEGLMRSQRRLSRATTEIPPVQHAIGPREEQNANAHLLSLLAFHFAWPGLSSRASLWLRASVRACFLLTSSILSRGLVLGRPCTPCTSNFVFERGSGVSLGKHSGKRWQCRLKRTPMSVSVGSISLPSPFPASILAISLLFSLHLVDADF